MSQAEGRAAEANMHIPPRATPTKPNYSPQFRFCLLSVSFVI
jgi:hypothetical protein